MGVGYRRLIILSNTVVCSSFLPVGGNSIQRSRWNLAGKNIPWVPSRTWNWALICNVGGYRSPKLQNLVKIVVFRWFFTLIHFCFSSFPPSPDFLNRWRRNREGNQLTQVYMEKWPLSKSSSNISSISSSSSSSSKCSSSSSMSFVVLVNYYNQNRYYADLKTCILS